MQRRTWHNCNSLLALLPKYSQCDNTPCFHPFQILPCYPYLQLYAGNLAPISKRPVTGLFWAHRRTADTIQGIFGSNTCTSYDGLDEILVMKEFKLFFWLFYSLQVTFSQSPRQGDYFKLLLLSNQSESQRYSIYNDRNRKQQILTFQKMEAVNVGFSITKDLNNSV